MSKVYGVPLLQIVTPNPDIVWLARRYRREAICGVIITPWAKTPSSRSTDKIYTFPNELSIMFYELFDDSFFLLPRELMSDIPLATVIYLRGRFPQT